MTLFPVECEDALSTLVRICIERSIDIKKTFTGETMLRSRKEEIRQRREQAAIRLLHESLCSYVEEKGEAAFHELPINEVCVARFQLTPLSLSLSPFRKHYPDAFVASKVLPTKDVEKTSATFLNAYNAVLDLRDRQDGTTNRIDLIETQLRQWTAAVLLVGTIVRFRCQHSSSIPTTICTVLTSKLTEDRRAWLRIRKKKEILHHAKVQPPLVDNQVVCNISHFSPRIDAIVSLQRYVRCKLAKTMMKRVGSKTQSAHHQYFYNSFVRAASFFTTQQTVALQYTLMTRKIEARERQVEEFFDLEAAEFNRQFSEWERNMKNYFLQDCPIDAKEWQTVKDPNSGQTVYVNISTGKAQEEHPNMLKAIATKNRQLLKASKERDARICHFRNKAAELREERQSLLDLETEVRKVFFLYFSK